MAVNIIKRTWHQNQMLKIEPLKGFAFQAENGGHTFQISGVDDSGNAVPISGTIAGVFLRPDNTDVALTGSASGGVASVTLKAECYAVPGRFLLTVYATSGSNKGTIYAAMGTVSRTSSGAVSPAAASDVVDLVNRINAATATIPASYTTLLNAVAGDYSDTKTYAVKDFVWYNGHLYRCTTAITTAETWTASHWNQVVLSDALNQDITDLKSALLNSVYGNGIADVDLWGSGGYRQTDAMPIDNTTRIRTINKFSADSFMGFGTTGDYSFCVYAWDDQNTYIGVLKTNGSFEKSSSSINWVTQYIFRKGFQYKLVMRKTSDPSATLTKNDGLNCSFYENKVNDLGNQIDATESTLSNRIDATESTLSNRIDATESTLSNRIDDIKNILDQSNTEIDATEKELFSFADIASTDVKSQATGAIETETIGETIAFGTQTHILHYYLDVEPGEIYKIQIRKANTMRYNIVFTDSNGVVKHLYGQGNGITHVDVETIAVPEDATRLYISAHDSSGPASWNENDRVQKAISVVAKESDIEKLNQHINLLAQDKISLEIGNFNTTTGEKNTDASITRIRNTYKIPVDEYYSIQIVEQDIIMFDVLAYANDGTYLGDASIYKKLYLLDDILASYPDAKYINICIRKTDNTAIDSILNTLELTTISALRSGGTVTPTELAEKANVSDVGHNSDLTTDDKTTLVAAINEVNARSLAPIDEAVSDWLDAHPEAVTTVQDGSITEAKLASSLKLLTIKDYVTPEMYNAYGDNLHDDSLAIQTAVNEAAGRPILFSAKSYRVDQTIVLKQYTKIVGINYLQTNYYHTTDTPIFSTDDSTGNGYIQIKDISFHSRVEDRTSYAMEFYNASFLQMENCRVILSPNSVNTKNEILCKQVSSTGFVAYFYRNTFSKCGLHLNGVTDSNIVENYIWRNNANGSAIVIEDSANTTIRGNELVGGSVSYIQLIPLAGSSLQGILIDNNYFDGSYNNVLSDYAIYGNTDIVRSLSITNNHFWQVKGMGIKIHELTSSVISNNLFNNCDYTDVGVPDIQIDSAHGSIISGNAHYRSTARSNKSPAIDITWDHATAATLVTNAVIMSDTEYSAAFAQKTASQMPVYNNVYFGSNLVT